MNALLKVCKTYTINPVTIGSEDVSLGCILLKVSSKNNSRMICSCIVVQSIINQVKPVRLPPVVNPVEKPAKPRSIQVGGVSGASTSLTVGIRRSRHCHWSLAVDSDTIDYGALRVT